MTKKIFIWVAHPAATSLSKAMADAYEAAAKASGAQVRRMDLAEMTFASAFTGYKTAAPLEADLLAWQDGIGWADHILVVHPYWWGAMPTRAKAVLDRALTPGFAYKYTGKGMEWKKLLAGRTGDAIITSDTPTIIDTLLYGSPVRRVIKNQVYKFCGVKPRIIAQFGSIKLASDTKIAAWIDEAGRMGASAAAQ